MAAVHFSLPARNEKAVARVVAALLEGLGNRCQTGRPLREQHGHTTSWIATQPPDAVVFPETAGEVQTIVRLSAAEGVPVIGFGTGTSLEGHVNAPAGGITVDFSRMNRVLSVRGEDMDCTVQPGVTRKQLNAHLRDTGLFFPVDPGADASLGGMAATRASGTNAVRYGTMRDAVLGVKAVLPSGELLSTAQRARKTSAGYDLTRLLIGSEGTLGLITELTLRLHGIPEAIAAATCSFPDVRSACAASSLTVQSGIPVARMELIDALSVRAVNSYSGLTLPEAPLLLFEFHGSAASVAEQADRCGEIAADLGGSGFTWTEKAEDRTRLWQARHDAYWAQCALRPGAKPVVTDVCVPVSALATCVAEAATRASALGMLAPIVGHVGDGNFHMSLLIDPADAGEMARAEEFVGWLNELAIGHDGTCTGEHGVGQGKAGYLARELGPEAVAIMRAIKRAVDPRNIMNPGKIFDIGNSGPV